MQAIRKYMTVRGETIHLSELRDWQNKHVEIIVLPAEEKNGHSSIRRAGSLKGKIHMASDFNDPIADFKDYM
jgi:hypothetical protein